MLKRYIPAILITLYLIIAYLPLFGEVDRIASQWTILSIVNFLGFFYLYSIKEINYKLFDRLNYPYFLFVLACTISLFFSINYIEGIIEIARHASVVIAMALFLKLSYLVKNPKKRILNTLFILFLIQLLAVSNQLYFDLPPIGLTGNKNIVAASLAMIFPIICLFFSKYSSSISKIILFIISTIFFSFLILIGSKAAILSSSVCTILFFLGIIIFYKKRNLIFQSLIIISSFGFSIILTSNQSKNYLQAVENTINYENDQGNIDRLRYYKETIEGFLESPIIGNGIGNWKILSVKYDAPYMNNYIVQYHAHNDFLQFLAETGLIGFIFYLYFFIQLTFLLLKKVIRDSGSFPYALCLLLSLFVYVIDANLNFPAARVVMQVNLISLFVLISIYTSNYEKK